MQAWRQADGRYVLIDDHRNETYNRRRDIARHGGWWDAPARHWVVPESALAPLAAQQVFGVICETVCCEAGGLEFRMVPGNEVQTGYALVRFCPHCDSRIVALAAIVENLGEPPDCRKLWEEEFRHRACP